MVSPDPAIVTAAGVFDDNAHFARRQFDVVEIDAGFESGGVERHPGAEGNGDGFNMACSYRFTGNSEILA